VRRHAKASSVQTSAKKPSAPAGTPSRHRLLLLALAIAAFLALPAAQASAEIVVDLAGPGAGTVTSNPPGINCSNVSGAPGPSCSSSFGFTGVELTASAGAGFEFAHWSGDDPIPGIFGPTCNQGSANPCWTIDAGLLGGGASTHITATFGCAPPVIPPEAETGEASAGEDPLSSTLAGTVNPNGCGLEKAYFEYGTSTEYGSTTATEPAVAGIGRGNSPVDVSAETDFLQPNATYHYRLVAVGPGGTAQGQDLTFNTGPAPGDNCPNALFRAEQGSTVQHLPDCMAVEMVSPPQKAGASAVTPSVSADGSRVLYESVAAIGDAPGSKFPSFYVASRGGSGWSSESTEPRLEPRLNYVWELRSRIDPSLSPDFSRWFAMGASQAQAERGMVQAFEAGVGHYVRALSEPLEPLFGPGGSGFYYWEVANITNFQAASADRSHLYFSPGAHPRYFADDPATGPDRGALVYLLRRDSFGEPVVELLQRDRFGKVWGGRCGARIGGIGLTFLAPNGNRNQGAVSADGSRTYLSTRPDQESGECDESANKLRILERNETANGPQITPLFASSECSRPAPDVCSTVNGDDLYQGASLDQSKVYFTTNRQLASSDLDGTSAECSLKEAVPGCDLYLYDRNRPVGERLVQVSAGEDVGGEHEAGKEADVYNGITGISADGSHVYFVAQGVLTASPNPANAVAQAGKPNLYLWDAGSEQTTFIGTLAAPVGANEGDAFGLWGSEGGTWRNDAYPVPILSPAEQNGEHLGSEGGDGHILVFSTEAQLTSNDADGRHADDYRFDAEAGTLECVSCKPGSSGADPDESAADVDGREGVFNALPLGTDYAEFNRWVSEDGQRIGFATDERLLAGDVNGEDDGYLWSQGSLARLPGKPFSGNVINDGPYLSHDGSTVAFATQTPLVASDEDRSADVYVARAGGGYPPPPLPQLCQGEECRGAPSAAPDLTGAGTAVLNGAGNATPKPSCAKGKVRRHGKCTRKASRHHRKHAKSNRRAGK